MTVWVPVQACPWWKEKRKLRFAGVWICHTKNLREVRKELQLSVSIWKGSSLMFWRFSFSLFFFLILFFWSRLKLVWALCPFADWHFVYKGRKFNTCTKLNHKLNKQGDNIQPWHIPFPIWNQSIISCLVLTVASWPTCRFLRRQVGLSGTLSLRIFHSDPHSQRLWRNQRGRIRCFSAIFLLFRWSNRCWQFDLWFLCLS